MPSAAVAAGGTDFPLPSLPVFSYTSDRAVVVVEGATVTSFVTEVTTMLVIELILSMFGIGLFCWLIFTLIVYALPFFVGLTAGMAAFHSGAGVIGALACRRRRRRAHPLRRADRIRIHPPAASTRRHRGRLAVPAGIAGYHAVLGLSQIGVPSLLWREVFAWIGALLIGGTAWARMTVFAEPLPLRPGGASRNELSRF